MTQNYHFRSDGYTVREGSDVLTIECLRCGHLIYFSTWARVAGISEELHSHRFVCGPVAITLQFVVTPGPAVIGSALSESHSDRWFYDPVLDFLFDSLARVGRRLVQLAKRAHSATIRLLAKMDETP